jgi:hypothetical protein
LKWAFYEFGAQIAAAGESAGIVNPAGIRIPARTYRAHLRSRSNRRRIERAGLTKIGHSNIDSNRTSTPPAVRPRIHIVPSPANTSSLPQGVLSPHRQLILK